MGDGRLLGQLRRALHQPGVRAGRRRAASEDRRCARRYRREAAAAQLPARPFAAAARVQRQSREIPPETQELAARWRRERARGAPRGRGLGAHLMGRGARLRGIGASPRVRWVRPPLGRVHGHRLAGAQHAGRPFAVERNGIVRQLVQRAGSHGRRVGQRVAGLHAHQRSARLAERRHHRVPRHEPRMAQRRQSYVLLPPRQGGGGRVRHRRATTSRQAPSKRVGSACDQARTRRSFSRSPTR